MPLIRNANEYYKTIRKQVKEPTPLDVLAVRELYTLDDVAVLLGISRRSVNSLITIKRRGDKPRLRTVREPETRIVRVTRADLEAYVKKLRVEAGITSP